LSFGNKLAINLKKKKRVLRGPVLIALILGEQIAFFVNLN